MTAVALLEPGARLTATRTPSAAQRVWRIVRLHYGNRMSSIGVPLFVAGIIFAVYLVVQALIVYGSGSNAPSGQSYSSALVYFLPYQVVFATQAMNLTFPYALGMTSTRRDFSFGTWLMFLIQATGLGLLFTLMSYVEQWTSGYGIHAAIFQTVLYGSGPLWERFVTFAGGILFMLCVGSVFGAVFVRWRAYGLYVLGAAQALLLLGALALITLTHSWLAVGHWFVSVGPAGFVGWLLLVAVVFAVIGQLALRHATPRS